MRRKDEPMKKLGSPEFDDKNHSEVTKSSSREKEKFQDEISMLEYIDPFADEDDDAEGCVITFPLGSDSDCVGDVSGYVLIIEESKLDDEAAIEAVANFIVRKIIEQSSHEKSS